MANHARFSPSSAHRWMRCVGSIAQEQGHEDSSSVHADEGTAAHFLASECLTSGVDASTHRGRLIVVERWACRWADSTSAAAAASVFEVDEDMAREVQKYLDVVRALAFEGDLMVEQRVDFSDVLNQPKQFGTSDAVIVQDQGREVIVVDLKYGRGVRVDADQNEQLMLYALGALGTVELTHGPVAERVRLVVHQPRLDHLSEWVCPIEDLRAFGAEAAAKADRALLCVQVGVLQEDLTPGEKQCRWCKAKATCPALSKHVEQMVGADFEVVEPPANLSKLDAQFTDALSGEYLATRLAAVPLIEDWCSAVRAETERRLLAGDEVPGFKLVEGRRGARSWTDKTEAEAALKGMRLKVEEMYDLTLISPTSAEKLAKAKVIGPRQWPKLQPLITQSQGKPSVAPASDKRPALVMTPTVDDFADVSQQATDVADLV